MNRAEQLKLELQAQRQRLDQETRLKAKQLQGAYDGISDLNYLGWSPRQLQEANVPLNFLKSAWQYKRMPVVERPELPASPAPPKQKAKKSEQPKKKKGPHWDSEWVAPVTQKFGADNWSGTLIIDPQESSEDEDEGLDESALKASIEAHGIDIKALENHIRQTSEALEKAVARVQEKKNDLRRKVEARQEMVDKLKAMEAARFSRIANSVARAKEVEIEPEAEVERGMEMEVESEEHAPEPEMEVEPEPELQLAQVPEPEPQVPDSKPQVPESEPQVPKPEPQVPESEPHKPTQAQAQPQEPTPEKVLETHPQKRKDLESEPDQLEPAPKKRANGAPLHVAAPLEAKAALPGPASPLEALNRYRLSPLWTRGRDVYSRTFNSFAVKDAPLCAKQLARQHCGGCDDAHFEDFSVAHTKVLRHILEEYVSSAQRRQFSARLKKLGTADSAESMRALLDIIYRD